jgi:hypothetical protein
MPVPQNLSCKSLHSQDSSLKARWGRVWLCHKGKNRTGRSACATSLLDGFTLRYVSEEIEDAALELGWLEAERSGVEGAGDFPELF